MAYRRSKKYSAARLKQMHAARDLKRADGYPEPLPDLRMRITVERFDSGEERHTFEMRWSTRVDQYRVFVDGEPWKVAGLSAVLEGVRKATPRVLSVRACA